MEDLDAEHVGFPADVIPLQYQALLLSDERRMSAFEEAITRVVTPGMRVLDLGAGTGVLSYFAARHGARVTAIEREPRVFATGPDRRPRGQRPRPRPLATGYHRPAVP